MWVTSPDQQAQADWFVLNKMHFFKNNWKNFINGAIKNHNGAAKSNKQCSDLAEYVGNNEA